MPSVQPRDVASRATAPLPGAGSHERLQTQTAKLPAAEVPMTQQRMIEAPMTEQPLTEQPLTEEPTTEQAMTELSIGVSAVRYRSPDGQFAVIDAVVQGGAGIVLTGAIGYLHEGEELEVEGRWRQHPRHGQRFEVAQARHSEPRSEAGLLAALSAIKHIGPRGAAFLYRRYGDESLAVVDRAPRQRLAEVPGIGRVRITEALRSWEEQRAQRALRMFLASHDVQAAVASRIYRAWGARSIDRLRADPYCITTLPGVGFQSADALARALGVASDAPQRQEAALRYTLEQAELEGHCCLPRRELERRARSLLRTSITDGHRPAIGGVALGECIDALSAQGRLVGERSGDHGELIYTAEMHAVERRLGGYVHALSEAPPALSAARARRPRRGALAPTDEQWRAVRLALEHTLSILTGGPGTGKTTSMRVLVEQLHREGASVCLCAPTGKAARRLARTTGEPASTIHRLLEWMPGVGFARGSENRLEGIEMLIVDEASMLSVRLAEALFAAVGPSTHVLLVGDVDQLPAVGSGRVLEDLIDSGELPVTALREVFRQAQRSLIVRAAHAINEGRPPPAARTHSADGERRDFFLLTRERERELSAEVVSLACERLAAHFGLDPKLEIQVLAPMRRGALGTEALGAQLRARLNPDGAPVPGTPLRVGDRVMQTRNDHEHDFMNGEVALVADRGEEGERVTLRGDDGRVLRLPPSALESVEPAYASSIHKSQGSQAPAVIVALARSHRIMLTRNLLYTAVTRAEQVCVVVAQPGALQLALGRWDARRRYTRLGGIVAGCPSAATDLPAGAPR
jgi:exodeoxyribonuclease V alpha subunit